MLPHIYEIGYRRRLEETTTPQINQHHYVTPTNCSTPQPEQKMETPCVYTKHSFFKSNSHDRNLHYKLCVAINHVIPNEIKAAQQIRGLWKIYLTTQDAKETLVRNGFRFNNNHVKIYTYDPFTQQTKPSENVV